MFCSALKSLCSLVSGRPSAEGGGLLWSLVDTDTKRLVSVPGLSTPISAALLSRMGAQGKYLRWLRTHHPSLAMAIQSPTVPFSSCAYHSGRLGLKPRHTSAKGEHRNLRRVRKWVRQEPWFAHHPPYPGLLPSCYTHMEKVRFLLALLLKSALGLSAYVAQCLFPHPGIKVFGQSDHKIIIVFIIAATYRASVKQFSLYTHSFFYSY